MIVRILMVIIMQDYQIYKFLEEEQEASVSKVLSIIEILARSLLFALSIVAVVQVAILNLKFKLAGIQLFAEMKDQCQ